MSKKYIWLVSFDAEQSYEGMVVATKKEAEITRRITNGLWLNAHGGGYCGDFSISDKPLRAASKEEIAKYEEMQNSSERV